MATKEQIDAARQRLEDRFAEQGACRSCGWHALLWEHSVDDSAIADALDNCGGVLRLYCQNHDDGDPVGHRGARIRIDA